MKTKKLLLSLLLPFLLLVACQTDDKEENLADENNEETQKDESAAVSRNQLGSNYYRPALNKDGNYITSKNRGVTLSLNSGINMNIFEKDLIRLSQEDYPTDEYLIREGQHLSEELVNSWINRKSEDNPDGLNPEDTGDEDNRSPRYLNSILELDFFKETEDDLSFSGLSIGLALNTVDYYPAYQFGPTLEQKIGKKEVLKEGKKIANEIISRIREMEDLADLPVMISLYKQAPRDDLSGGVYIAQGTSSSNSTEIESWQDLNEKRVVFPLAGQSSAEGNAFANFQSEVESFFPNVSGITGRAHFVDEKLGSLTINIMTQFYGETEMISYAQYLKQSAATYLPADIAVEIVVESSAGVEVFLEKGPADAEFYSHVFD